MRPTSHTLRDETPFFIVGSGRSGTTLLRSLLGAHSELAVTPETHFMKRAYREGAATRDAPADFAAFWRDLVAWRRFREIGVDPDRVLARIEGTGSRDFRTVFTEMLAAYAEAEGKRRVGEKTPGHYRYLDKIFAWFPGTRVLATRRDPRDVVASHLRAPWVTEQVAPRRRLRAPLVRRLRLFHVAERALLWRQANGEFLAAAGADPRMHVVVYEDLVADPEHELKRICAFLGEAYQPEMLTRRVMQASLPRGGGGAPWSDWSSAHLAKADAPVSPTSVGRWREALTPAEAALVEAICGSAMSACGYRPEMPRTPRRFLGQALLRAGLAEDRVRRTLNPGWRPR